MTREETGRLLTLLRECYPHVRLSRERQEAIHLALEPYTYATGRAALLEHVRSKPFAPTPSELAALCQQRQPWQPDSEPSESWSPEYCAMLLSRAAGLGIDPDRFPALRQHAKQGEN